MSRRVIDVAIRSEFRKGFGDVAKQLSALERSLAKTAGLQSSLNKLAQQFERANNFNAAASKVKKLESAQKDVNKQFAEGIRLAKAHETAHTKLGRQVGILAASEKAGAITKKQRMEAEIALLDKYIKKTNDLSVLNSKANNLRGSNGRFTQFSAASLSRVAGANVVARPSVNPARRGAGLDTQSLINRNTGVAPALDSRFEMLKEHYRRLEGRAQATSARIQTMKFGPNAQQADHGFKKLFDNYNRLGHFLFQLQYSTLTIFGLSGIGMILQQADAYTTLRNQVARTSDSLVDLESNMSDVFKISRDTFADPKSVGKIFSTINKYSQSLGLDRQQVGGVTGAISGAFAASPGNAAEKSASQYQFMQAIQSNRLGGDELRSVLEMAPYVGDILAKGIAKNRGMPEGSVIDLRAQKGKVDAKEIVKVFNDPAIQAEIKNTLGAQARTFGDMMMVGKVRLMEMTKSFAEGTGIFSNLINMISRFLMNDTAFDKFTKALSAATVALGIYAGMLAVQGLKGVGAKGAGMLANLVASRGALGSRNMVAAIRSTDAIGAGIAGGARAAVGAARAAPGAIAGATSAAIGTLSGVIGKLGTTAKTSGGILGAAVNSLKGMFGGLLSGIKGLFSARTLTVILSGLKSGFRSLMIGANFLLRGLLTLNIPLILIASVIAAIALRFNKLLGEMTGGMNIMDILTGSWRMLVDGMSKAASFLKTTFLGEIWSAITGFVDGILKFLGRKVAENPIFKEEQLKRQYGLTSATVYDSGTKAAIKTIGVDGKALEGIAMQQGSRGSGTKWKTDGKGNLAVYKDGKIIGYAPQGGAVPTGQQANLPATVPDGSKTKDPWPEFIRDMRLKIQQSLEGFDLAPQVRELQADLNENLRRAMDVTNFDSSKFDTLGAAWEAFSKQNAAKAAEVDAWNEKLKNNKLLESMREFVQGVEDWIGDAMRDAKKAGMNAFVGQAYDDRVELINRYLNDNKEYRGNAQDVTDTKFLLNRGRVDDAEKKLLGNLGDGQAISYEQDRGRLENARAEKVTNTLIRNNELARSRLVMQSKVLGYFGKERDVQSEILEIQRQFVEEHGAELLTNEKIKTQLADQIKLVKEKAAIEAKYNANAFNGVRESLAEYNDGLSDLAGQTKDAFGNALKGIEDAFVNLITTGKTNLHDLLVSVQGDIARIFVRTFIMKPITNWLEGMASKLFPTAMEDKVINAHNVYINSSPLGQMLGQGTGLFGGSAASAAHGGSNKFMQGLGAASNMLPPPFNLLSSLFSLFHEGGTVGQAGASRMVNPSVFRNAKRYHTGTNFAGLPALGVNEVPAILKQGEKVLTASQYSAMNSGGGGGTTFAPNVQVNYTSNASGSNGESGGTKEDANKVGAIVKAAVNEAIMAYDARQRKPGSPGYLSKRYQ